MLKKCVVIFCVLSLIGFVSCKKSDSDGAAPVTDQFIEDIFGGDDGGGDFLDDTSAGTACNNNGECDTDESTESCPADCPKVPPKGNNPLSATLKVSTDNNVPPINELKEFIATLKMSNYDDHVVSYSYEIVSGEGIINIDVEEELTEINRIRYLIKGLTPGSAVIQFMATDVDDTEKVFDATFDVEVLKSELKNKSIIDPSTILVDTGMVTLSKISKGGSDLENHVWDPVVINRVDSNGIETAVTQDEFKMEDDEDGNEIYTFYTVGNFIFQTKVTDDSILAYVAESRHPFTVNETVAVNKYVVDMDDPEACMNDPECRRELIGAETIEYGSGIAIVVDGKDTYTCNGGALSEELELTEQDVDIFGLGKMICLISLAQDSDDEELVKNNEEIDLESLYSGTKPVSFPSLTFAPNPCAVPSEIVVEKVEIASEVNWFPGQYISIEGESLIADPESGETKFSVAYDKYVKITLRVLNGKGGYDWSLVSDEIIDSAMGPRGDCMNVVDLSNCHTEETDWEFQCDDKLEDGECNSDMITLKSRMKFDMMESKTLSEKLTVRVIDQCESNNTSEKLFKMNVSLPDSSEEIIGNLTMYADYYTYDIDEYCWIRFRLEAGGHWAGWTKQYATSDPKDDDIHQQITPYIDGKKTLSFNPAYVEKTVNYITKVKWHIDDNDTAAWGDMNYTLSDFFLMGKYYYREITETVKGEVTSNTKNPSLPLGAWKVCPYPEKGCLNGIYPEPKESNTPKGYTTNGSSDFPSGDETSTMCHGQKEGGFSDPSQN